MPETSFRFITYRDFKRTLGKVNAVAECTELAIRLLADNAQKSGDANSYIQQISRTYGVRVDVLDLASLSQQIAHFHVVSVHQQFEYFLRDFRAEHPKTDWHDDENDDLFKRVLKALPGGYDEVVGTIGRLEVELADYYRLVRNKFVHALEDAVHKDVEKLRSRVLTSDEYSRLGAPNLYSKISFDDFILFSRAVKKIALGLCSAARPSDPEIAAMLIGLNERKHPGVSFARLKANARDPERMRNALSTLLRSVYSLDENESGPIINELIAGPLA